MVVCIMNFRNVSYQYSSNGGRGGIRNATFATPTPLASNLLTSPAHQNPPTKAQVAMSSSSAHDFFRNRIRQLRNPSKRTPDRETTLDNADNIER